MIRRDLLRVVFFLFCFAQICALVSTSGGQAARATVNLTDGAGKVCSWGNIKFQCPERYEVIEDSGGNKAIYFRDKEYDFGLFVATPGTADDVEEFAAEIAKSAAQKLWPKETRPFAWKRIEYLHYVSKHEVRIGSIQGFNGRSRVFAKYRQVKFDGKDFIVGDVHRNEKEKDAARMFDQGLDGFSMMGCYDSVKIIYSVTGEKLNHKDYQNHPCSVNVVTRPVNE